MRTPQPLGRFGCVAMEHRGGCRSDMTRARPVGRALVCRCVRVSVRRISSRRRAPSAWSRAPERSGAWRRDCAGQAAAATTATACGARRGRPRQRGSRGSAPRLPYRGGGDPLGGFSCAMDFLRSGSELDDSTDSPGRRLVERYAHSAYFAAVTPGACRNFADIVRDRADIVATQSRRNHGPAKRAAAPGRILRVR